MKKYNSHGYSSSFPYNKSTREYHDDRISDEMVRSNNKVPLYYNNPKNGLLSIGTNTVNYDEDMSNHEVYDNYDRQMHMENSSAKQFKLKNSFYTKSAFTPQDSYKYRKDFERYNIEQNNNNDSEDNSWSESMHRYNGRVYSKRYHLETNDELVIDNNLPNNKRKNIIIHPVIKPVDNIITSNDESNSLNNRLNSSYYEYGKLKK